MIMSVRRRKLPNAGGTGQGKQELEITEGETVPDVDFVLLEREEKQELIEGQVFLPSGQPAASIKVHHLNNWWPYLFQALSRTRFCHASFT